MNSALYRDKSGVTSQKENCNGPRFPSGTCIQERHRSISASVHSTRGYLAGTSFTRILHPLKFRLSAEDYAKYYFAGGPRARARTAEV